MPRFFEEVRENAARYQLPKIAFIAEGTDIQSPTPRVVENIRKWNTQGHYPPMVYASTTDLFSKSEGSPVPSSAVEMPSPWDSAQAQGNECFSHALHRSGRDRDDSSVLLRRLAEGAPHSANPCQHAEGGRR
jgi:hypothetical protein